MTDLRVEKVTVGTPTYKVVVGDVTRVKEIVLGTPTRNVLISNQVNLNDVIGITVDNVEQGDLLIADSNGILVNSKDLRYNQVIDGLVYDRDSNHGYILIRRSPDVGEPAELRAGELAYSYLTDIGIDGIGNGGDRLYIGIGSDQTELASRIDVIGGKYFTDLLNHQHGILTPSSAVIVDENKFINEWFATQLYADSARIENLSVNNLLFNNIDSDQLRTSIVEQLVEGEGINIRESDGKIVVEAEFATATNAGIVSLDSTQFSVGGTGQTEITTLDGGTF